MLVIQTLQDTRSAPFHHAHLGCVLDAARKCSAAWVLVSWHVRSLSSWRAAVGMMCASSVHAVLHMTCSTRRCIQSLYHTIGLYRFSCCRGVRGCSRDEGKVGEMSTYVVAVQARKEDFSRPIEADGSGENQNSKARKRRRLASLDLNLIWRRVLAVCNCDSEPILMASDNATRMPWTCPSSSGNVLHPLSSPSPLLPIPLPSCFNPTRADPFPIISMP